MLVGWLVGVGACSTSPEEDTFEISHDAARDYGRVIGDLIEHALHVKVDSGYRLDPESLPPPGPVNEWLSIRDLQWRVSHQSGHDDYRIDVTYQLFRGVKEAEPGLIPPLELRFVGDSVKVLKSPSWSFHQLPLIPSGLSDDEVVIRGFWPPEPVDSAPTWRRMGWWSVLLLLAGLLWGLRTVLWRRESHPFSEAWQRIRRIRREPSAHDRLLRVVRVLHEAFDRSFGETLFASEIERFCLEHPPFMSHKELIYRFFTLSQELFFEGDNHDDEGELLEWMAELSRRCVTAERKMA